MEEEMEVEQVELEAVAEAVAVAEADGSLTQEEADRLIAQQALELWAEHCELNQELYEPAEGDFDYEAMSDCDEEYEIERYAYAGDEGDEKPSESNSQ